MFGNVNRWSWWVEISEARNRKGLQERSEEVGAKGEKLDGTQRSLEI